VKGAIEQLTRTPPEKALTLSTIHKAKGSEWDRVIYLDYGREWPGAQESNVRYVGITRSKQSLLLHLEKSSTR
jgi:superfamily I DNA/RNA helicase